MSFQPLINLRATTISKAFFLNAVVLASIATFSIELRRYLDIRSETKGLTEVNKILITLLGTFFIGIIIYVLTRLLFGFGEGLLGRSPFSKNFL